MSEMKSSNPKDAIGGTKLPLHLWPTTATAMGCLGMLEGMCKYGRSNFRIHGVLASVYISAAMRHLALWFEGEDNDPVSGVPHLGNALSCIAIIVDAMAAGKLLDDRMVTGGYRAFVDQYSPYVEQIKATYGNYNPQHFSIADSKPND